MTYLTICSTRISVFGTCCIFIFQRNRIHMIGRAFGIICLRLRSVVMASVPGCIVCRLGCVIPNIRLRIHLNSVTCESSIPIENTGNYRNADINRPCFTTILENLISHMLAFVRSIICNKTRQFPRTDWHGNQSKFSCIIACSCLCNSQTCNILITINNVINCRKSIGYFHVIKFPMADVIKI